MDDAATKSAPAAQPTRPRRPWPLYPAALACVAPASLLVIFISADPSILREALQSGTTHTLVFLTGLVFAFLLGSAGVLLFFQRKLGLWLLLPCLAWCIVRPMVVPAPLAFTVALATGILAVLAYGIFLDRRGLLR